MASAEGPGRPPRLSVVIPAKDEVARIEATVAEVRAALGELGDGGSGEIVVVDDGSTDGTGAAAAAAGARVVTLPVNRGKGAAATPSRRSWCRPAGCDACPGGCSTRSWPSWCWVRRATPSAG